MKENLSTIIAVGGVVGIVGGIIVYAICSGQPLDYEVIKEAIAALIGFAGGAATVKLVS